MIEYSAQVNAMCPITKGPKHGPAPIPEEGQWVKAYKIEDISGYTHGVGWCKNIFLLQIELIIFITPVSRITFSC